MWKAQSRARRSLPARARGQVRAQLRAPESLKQPDAETRARLVRRQSRVIIAPERRSRSPPKTPMSDARALPPHPVLLAPSATTATSTGGCSSRAEGPVRPAPWSARSGSAGRGERGRHDLLRRRDAVAARTGGDRPTHHGLPRDVRRHAGRRDHARDQPRNLDGGRMDGFRDAGVNRVSFGVQSFRTSELARLGRIHSVDRAREAVAEARAAGFDNVSLDLMMWLPQQTPATGGERRGADRRRPRACVAVSPRAVSERAAQGGRWRAPAGRWRPMTMRRRCICGAWAARGGRIPPIRDLERGAPGASRGTTSNTGRTASGSGSAAARTRPADGVRWKNVCRHRGLRSRESPRASRCRSSAATHRPGTSGRALFTGLRLAGARHRGRRRRYGVDVWGRFAPGLAALRRGGDRAPRGRPGSGSPARACCLPTKSWRCSCEPA